MKTDLPSDTMSFVLQRQDALPHNLPVQLTSFVGREREIEEIKRLLKTTRLLTLTGAGGAGKTRLSLQVAADLVEEYEDGVWLVELAPLADPERVAGTVATILGVCEQPGQPLLDVLIDFLRAKEILVVLDNCEHLIEACARFADALLRACPSLYILATSREALGIGGEITWIVPALSIPNAHAPRPNVADLSQFEAVQLFVARAEVVQANFKLTELNAEAVAQICQRLDGIPLAIELAAARVNVLQTAEIAARLDDRFGLLTGGSRTALPRQQTLHALLDWSYNLLTEEERALFRMQAVFVGGFTLDAVESINEAFGGQPNACLDVLSRLVEKSLVFPRPQNETTRYFMLETIREFAREKLRAMGEEKHARQMHFTYFYKLLGQINETWNRNWATVLLSERENLRAALAWTIQFSQEPNASSESIGRALEYAYALSFDDVDDYHAVVEWVNGLPAPDDLAGPAAIFKLLILVEWESNRGHIAASHELAPELLARAQASGDKQLLAKALRVCSFPEVCLENNPKALQYMEEARTLFVELNNPREAQHMTYFMAETYAAMGEVTTAESLWEEGLAWMRINGDNDDIAWGLEGLGNLACVRGDFEQARTLYRTSIQLKFEIRETYGILFSLSALAQLAVALEEPARAARLWGASDRLREQFWTALAPYHRQFYWSGLLRAKEILGEDAFRTAWAEGRAMTWEQSIAYALEQPTPRGQVPSPQMTREEAKQKFGGLTERERRVAAHIAQGESNREIAKGLVVSERTVETHVTNILNKLGFTSRGEIRKWAVEKGLVKRVE